MLERFSERFHIVAARLAFLLTGRADVDAEKQKVSGQGGRLPHREGELSFRLDIPAFLRAFCVSALLSVAASLLLTAILRLKRDHPRSH